MRHIIRFRQRVARSPLGTALRRLNLHKALDRPYDWLLTRKGENSITVLGRPVRFRTTARREAVRVSFATGELDHIESICADLKPDDVFYDVGANIGMFCCSAGMVCPTAQIHAFEPEPMTAARLRENVQLNAIANATVHAIAASDTNATLDLNVSNEFGAGTHSLIPSAQPGDNDTRRVPVPVRPLTAYANEQGMPPPTVVKCDVEGAEAGVIRGIEPWLKAGNIRRLDVEFHPKALAEMGESAEELQKIIIGAGYHAEARSARTSTFTVSFRRDPQTLDPSPPAPDSQRAPSTPPCP